MTVVTRKKNVTSEIDSINEIQVSDSDHSTNIEDNDSIGWRSIPHITTTLYDSNICDTDEAEWLDDSFCEQKHMISKLEYAKLKWPTLQSNS